MRAKIIVLSLIILISLTLIIFLFMTVQKKTPVSSDEIQLRTDIKDSYTIDDMVKSVKDEIPSRRYTGSEIVQNDDAENLARIQKLIQENEKAFQSPAPSPTEPPVQTRSKIEDTLTPDKKVPDTIPEEIAEVKVEKRRTFNSIRLVKENESNAIKAFVHSTQTVMVGSTLKMQLAENCLTDDGQRVRKGTPVYGEVTAIDGERVIVKITTINIDNNILPFKKNVFSRDALEGIYVPGNPKADATKEASSAAVQGANANITGGYDLGTQLVAGAANSVISATKSVTSSNIRKIKVTIKTNYQLLLMEDTQG